MALPVPYGLSPSKVESFKSCALAFRFSAIDRLPEPPSPWATKGTLVHRALELLFEEPARSRTLEAALTALDRGLHRDGHRSRSRRPRTSATSRRSSFLDDAEALVRQYFRLEDPDASEPDRARAATLGRGRRHHDARRHRPPRSRRGRRARRHRLQDRASRRGSPTSKVGCRGVNFYALLCERVLGRRPARVQLLYLSEPLAIVATPSDQKMSFLDKKVGAIWTAVERACRTEDFRPQPRTALRLLRLQGVLPRVRWRPDAGRSARQLDVRAVPEPVLL